ncbi:carbon monoxide dehydrogenase subunit G [Streptomyces sp. PTM05]|uniref:Carbon monoxide dehydrogenase subunit G n=1 Tax=Streptantibioticus parmotrematis TaxID=2873249 RepID=A0ABS7QXS1_9ACTN|nr:SRPBCC domain-containing protein [Streptantibioticus parmotrematis]MBY8886589.1 carbon monoxide dehydrogenase subunit G [Streptantibioticus parmotrematis]
MEHEAFVPFPVEVVRQALTEPDRVARCVSALQRDDASPTGTLAGRLRLRIGGSTITYRGSLRIAACDGGFEIEGEGTEARGTGAIKVALVIGLDPEEGGTRMDFSGAVQADGRLTEYDEATTEASGRRLLERFVSDLTTDLQAEPVTLPEPAEPAEDASDTPGEGDEEDEGDDDGVAALGVEVPETVAEIEDDLRGTGPDGDEPPAEAAHARRTMIGRSAEEVDHAPPRGRYAPVPAPETGSATDTLRWAAPAAAALLASAVVVGRVLRRRR